MSEENIFDSDDSINDPTFTPENNGSDGSEFSNFDPEKNGVDASDSLVIDLTPESNDASATDSLELDLEGVNKLLFSKEFFKIITKVRVNFFTD